jgi:hypothetical protein
MPAEMASIMGLFTAEAPAAEAVADLNQTAFTLERVHSPVPSEALAAAMHAKKSPVGWFTLTGGIIGFFSGFLLAAFTALRWSLIVGGKPIVALVPFVIVGFEFTILFSIFGNVAGLIYTMALPRWKMRKRYDPRCTNGHFGILAACPADQRDELIRFFEQRGAQVRSF